MLLVGGFWCIGVIVACETTRIPIAHPYLKVWYVLYLSFLLFQDFFWQGRLKYIREDGNEKQP